MQVYVSSCTILRGIELRSILCKKLLNLKTFARKHMSEEKEDEEEEEDMYFFQTVMTITILQQNINIEPG